MICNWFKVTPNVCEEIKEEVIVRDFVKKIAEKIIDRSFVYDESFFGCIERNLKWKDIKVSVSMGYIFLYVFGKKIPLNLPEEKLIVAAWNILREERVKANMEKQDSDIKAAEEYFNE